MAYYDKLTLPEMELEDFFFDIFLPKSGRTYTDDMMQKYRLVFAKLEDFIGRRPKLDDLQNATIIAYAVYRQGKQEAAAATVNREVEHIKSIWNWAAKKRYVDAFPEIRRLPVKPNRIKCKPKHKPARRRLIARRQPQLQDKRYELGHFYKKIYRPALVRGEYGEPELQDHDLAVQLLHSFTNQKLLVFDITRELIEDFADHLRSAGLDLSANFTDLPRVLHAIERIKRTFNPPSFALPRFELIDPDPAPGTLKELFLRAYQPQRLYDTTPENTQHYLIMFRMLRRFLGRDLLISEQTDELATEYFKWLCDRGVSRVRINRGHRATWFTVWRFASELKLIDRVPRARQLKTGKAVPDAWTVDEVNAILQHVGFAYRGGEIGGIRAELYWDALLRTAWWTGLRRGTLLQLRFADLDIESGWLTVPPQSIKNRRGQKFRLGPDAVESLRRILFPDRELLFPWTLCKREISKHFHRIVDAAGIVRSGRNLGLFHKMRRSTATHMMELAGIDAASKLLGHSTHEMTDRYIDPSKVQGNDATLVLPGLWSSISCQPPKAPHHNAGPDSSVDAALSESLLMVEWL